MKQTAVAVNNVSVKLNGASVLEKIDFTADYGSVTGIVGPNGAGKSVFFKTLTGFVRGQGTSVSVNGQELLRTTRFPLQVGSLIEEPYFLPNLSGLDNLVLLASIKRMVSKEDIRTYLKMFDLPDDKRPVKVYSLGMKKKLAIIQTFMEGQTIVILDEPMNALDEESVVMLRAKIKQLAHDEQRAVLLTSHNAEDIRELCDDVYQISNNQMKKVF
jgi:ABC-2 type transport system ATP-binding protein